MLIKKQKTSSAFPSSRQKKQFKQPFSERISNQFFSRTFIAQFLTAQN